ncbi:MAG: response regulator transcription factor [Betaproteobacteria bacterium]|nr:response regulator transcription factor [Betaproteobacteria bacterium]
MDMQIREQKQLVARVAIIEDDATAGEAIVKWVEEMGHQPMLFPDAGKFLAARAAHSASLLILDWGLPDMSGLELLRHVRGPLQCSAPAVFCTSRGDEADVVEALRAGADDFIVKPLRKQELQARVSAVLRRSVVEVAEMRELEVAPYKLDLVARRIRLNDRVVELQNREYELAVLLFQNLNTVVSRERIVQTLWGMEPMETSRTLDTHVSRLRRKLELTPANGLTLQSVYGLGYRLQPVSA